MGTAAAALDAAGASGRREDVHRLLQQAADAGRRRTGAARRVELFVAVLGASSLTYAEATETQQLPDWVGAHIRMVEYFGGATTLWVPGQLFTVTNGDVTGARRKNGQHDEWTIGVQFRLSGRDRWTCPSVSEVASARPLAFASVPAPPWSVLNGTSAPPCAVR